MQKRRKTGDLSSTYTLNVGRSVAHTSVTTEQPTREEEGGVKNFNPSGEELKNFTRGVKNLNPQQTERQNTATTTNSLQKKNDAHSLQPANDNVVAALTSWGISQNVSKQLANRFSPTYIGEKIAFLEFLLKQEPARVKKPAAWLRSAIEDDYTAPDGFKTTAELERQANEEKERKQASVEAQKAYSDRSEQHWKEQEAERSARLQKLHHHYHTTQADFAFWGKAQTAMSAHGVSDVLIAYMQILKLEANQVIIHVRNHFMRQQLEKPKITQQIEAALHEVTDQPVELVFVVGDQIEEGSHEQ